MFYNMPLPIKMTPVLLHNPIAVLPDWPGQPAQQIVNSKLLCRTMTSAPGVTSYLTGDTLIALSADDGLSRALAGKLSVRWNDLSEGGFAIVPQEKRLLVLGVDKRGSLSG